MSEIDGYAKQRHLLELASKEANQPFLAGGFAEDAVLYHKPSRPHFDIDWFMMRQDLDRHLALAKKLGLTTQNTYGNNAKGQPFYMSCTADESLWVDFVIADLDDNGDVYLEIAELINIDTSEFPPLKPFRLYLSSGIFDSPKSEFDGLMLQTVSPRALYEFRLGLHVNKTFGELRDKDIKSMKALKDVFFANVSEQDLVPRTELI